MTSLSDDNRITEDKEDKDWNEAALAELVGLESKAREENTNYHTSFDDNNVITQGDLFDSPTTNPHENKTERSLAKKPLPKLGLVGVGLLAVFGIGGLALSSMMGVKKPNLSNPLAKSSTENTTSIVAKKTDENQEGKLKTQLALASQAEDLKAIDSRAKDKKREGVKPGEKEQKTTPTPTPNSTTIKPVDSTPTTSYHPPPPTPVAYSPPPRSPSPSPPRSPSPPTPVAYPPPTRSPSPPPQESPKPLPSADSSEQWHRLAMLGSYGRVEEIGVQGERIQGENISQNSPPLSPQPASSGMAQQPISPEISSPPPVVIADDEDRVLRGITVKRLIPGTVASAFLSTSLVWADESQIDNFSTQKSQFEKSQSGNFTTEKYQLSNYQLGNYSTEKSPAANYQFDNSSTVKSQTEKSQTEKSQANEKYFVVTLAESLVDVDGNEAIRAGEQIVFRITAVSSNGLVTATAVSLIDEQGIERPLPAGAITVQRDSEKPLLAEGLFDSGGQIASMDFGIAGLGAVAKIGEILNRPKQQQQQSISGSQISTTTSSTTGNPNIIGAVMEGAATPVLESIQKRNQEAIERLSEQENVWFLPVGESVQVIVTKPFDL